MSTASGSRCLVCGGHLDTSPVWCTGCGTPHHEECFTYNGRCAIYGCSGLRFSREGPRGRGVTEIEIKAPGGGVRLQSYIVDFESPREVLTKLLVGVGLSAAGLACLLVLPGMPWIFWALWLLAGGAGISLTNRITKLIFNDYWVVDGKSGTIWLHRESLLGVSQIPTASFSAVKGIVVRRLETDTIERQHQAPELVSTWAILLQLEGQRTIELTRQDIDGHEFAPRELSQTGHRIAKLTNAPLRSVPEDRIHEADEFAATPGVPALSGSTSAGQEGWDRKAHAVVFDLDTAVPDVREAHLAVLRGLLAEEKLEMTDAMRRDFAGLCEISVFEKLSRQRLIRESVPRLAERYDGMLRQALDTPLEPAKGLTWLLDELKKRQCKLGLVASYRSDVVSIILENSGLSEWFDLTISIDMVKTPKPAPDLYRLALDRLGEGARDTIAVEGSSAGVASAGAARLVVLAIPTPLVDRFQMLGASGAVASLREFPLDLIQDHRGLPR